MAEPDAPNAPAPNVAQLKAAIDAGKTGDKAAAHDPAAAPLGTDAEASGAPPTSGEVADAMRRESSGASPRKIEAKQGARPEQGLQPAAPRRRRATPLPVLVGGGAGLVVAAILLTLSGRL